MLNVEVVEPAEALLEGDDAVGVCESERRTSVAERAHGLVANAETRPEKQLPDEVAPAPR